MPISIASEKDISEMITLLNSAYRGEASKKGWTSEADMIAGELRTDEKTMKQLMQTTDAAFLKYMTEDSRIAGCAYVHRRNDRLYFGMLAVSPAIQAKGIGKHLMRSIEHYAREKNCSAVFMRVISIRHELVNWYEKLGYRDTGVTEPFPENDPFGTPTLPLEFMIMEKKL